jgi:tRNA 5-methylaminomethyl-2-thiouridine biosynthesis bifunctional protein
LRQIQHKPKSIAIIGAGISGAATAFSLANRGYQVTVFEQNNLAASEASGNYQGMLYGSWSAFGGEMMELSSSAYRYSHNLIKNLLTTSNGEFAECGIIQLAHSQQQSKRNQQLLTTEFANQFIKAVNKSEIQKLANCTLATNIDGAFFPHGLWLHPPALVNALLRHKNITLINNCKITDLKPCETIWHVYHDSIAESFDAVVLCNSHMLNQFEISQNLPIRKIRGQISISETDSNLTSILCGDGYITPNKGNKFTFGATFDFKNENCDITERDHQENINNFNEIIPAIMNKINIKELSGNTNLRASPHDYIPIVGQLAKREYFMTTYAKISKDKNAQIKSACEYIPNLYLNIGHGSKGMLTAPFCGEIITDYIDGTVLPISQKLRYALHPNRFYIRELVKSKK